MLKNQVPNALTNRSRYSRWLPTLVCSFANPNPSSLDARFGLMADNLAEYQPLRYWKCFNSEGSVAGVIYCVSILESCGGGMVMLFGGAAPPFCISFVPSSEAGWLFVTDPLGRVDSLSGATAD